MAIYTYKAVNIDGNVIKGKLEASNEEVVREILKGKGYIPEELNEEKDISPFFENLFSTIQFKDLAFFCSDMNFALSAGIPIMNVLEIAKNRCENKTLKKCIGKACEEVRRGKPLSEAFKDIKQIPSMLNYMIEAGEASGKLDIVMENMSDYYHNQHKTEKKIKSATMYPKILLGLTIAVSIFMIMKIVPKFSAALKGELPLPTKIVLGINKFLSTNYMALIIAIIGVFLFKKLYLDRNNKYCYYRDKFLMKCKFTKPIVEKIVVSRFSRTFSLLFSSGIGIIETIDITSNAVGNIYFKDGLIKSKELINRGTTISEAFSKIEVFPEMLVQSIKIGEETGKMESILIKSSAFYEVESDFSIKKLTTLLEPIMIIVLALIVGFVMLSIILPMFQIYETMG